MKKLRRDESMMNRILKEVNQDESKFKFFILVNARPSFLVNQLHGPCKTIDEAIEQCPPNSNIYLTEGVYFISNPITKPGLIF